MSAKCAKCGADLPKRSGRGRPATYCSVACRRLAENELRRIDRRLERIEGELSELRRGAMAWLPAAQRRKLAASAEAEIAYLESRMRQLLSGPPTPVLRGAQGRKSGTPGSPT